MLAVLAGSGLSVFGLAPLKADVVCGRIPALSATARRTVLEATRIVDTVSGSQPPHPLLANNHNEQMRDHRYACASQFNARHFDFASFIAGPIKKQMTYLLPLASTKA